MTLTERMFGLKHVPGFDQLRDEELVAVAASMTERRYGPGEAIVTGGSSIWHLLVIVAGSVLGEGSGPVGGQVVGADLLLTNQASPETLSAGPEGAVCLRMNKGHFFTVVSECPALLVEMSRLRVIDRDRGAVTP